MTVDSELILSPTGIPKTWWKSAVVYHIYPQSFLDTNGDGLGDLPGVLAKLDYLKDLGVDVAYLGPIFKSPQIDNGYDISGYQEIHEPYGSVEDVDTLIAELHKRGMKLLLDLVVNHTSWEHPWFKESRSSKTNPKRNWYFWRPAKYDPDGTRREPNNWRSRFGGPAWTWDETTQEYYLHIFDPSQPDLNWDTEEVREEVYKMMRWWLDRGADGYRMDVIARISKFQDLPDAPVVNPGSRLQDITRDDGPRLHEFLNEMHTKVLSKYDTLTVGELNGVTPEGMLKFTHPDRREIGMGFCFDHCNVGLLPGGLNQHVVREWTIPQLKLAFSRWQIMREYGAWHALYLENHDQPRSISRWMSDAPEHRWNAGKTLALLHSTLFGTLYLFQGQELGMINLPTDWPVEEWKDVQTQNHVVEVRELGIDVDETIKQLFFKARDNARSPMQWTDGPYGGFSTAKPWMRPNDGDLQACNAAQQLEDPNSLWRFWKRVLAFRKENDDTIIYGSFRELSPDHESVYAYVRDDKVLVLLNLSDREAEYTLPESFPSSKLLLATTDDKNWPSKLDKNVVLTAYSGAVYAI